MAAYPHPALHIASIRKGDQEEAEDHAEYHVPKGEMRSAGSPDELYDLFASLGRQGANLAYLDFHCHGYPGSLDLGKQTLNYTHLDKFRRGGFDTLFRSGATISFLSCDVAAVAIDQDNEDGELFLAEFAHIFLRSRGGKAVGRNMPWHYKPSTVWRGPIFYNQGSEIVAEVAAGASRAVLKGQYRLDEGRIKTEIAVLRGFIAAALGSLPGQQAPKSYLQDSLSLPVQRMVADGVRKVRSDDVEKNRQAYANCIRLLDNSIAGLRVLSSQYYLKYHNACLTIEEVVDVLVHLGVPLGQIMPPILNMMHGMPVSR